MHRWGSRNPLGLSFGLPVPQGQFRGPQTRPNSYEEQTLQNWFNDLPFMLSDHGSGRTWDQGPSQSRFGVQKGDPPPLNQGRPATFVL